METTASTIATGLDTLAEKPVLQERLRQVPDLIGGFVDEVMRLAPPVRRLTPRITNEPVSLGQTEIPAGCGLILHVERAQRDPAAYPEPETIQLNRNGPPLLAFGGGAHACIGSVLGRMQVCVMLDSVLRRLRLAPGSEPAVLTGDPNLRQYARLPLTLTRIDA